MPKLIILNAEFTFCGKQLQGSLGRCLAGVETHVRHGHMGLLAAAASSLAAAATAAAAFGWRGRRVHRAARRGRGGHAAQVPLLLRVDVRLRHLLQVETPAPKRRVEVARRQRRLQLRLVARAKADPAFSRLELPDEPRGGELGRRALAQQGGGRDEARPRHVQPELAEVPRELRLGVLWSGHG